MSEQGQTALSDCPFCGGNGRVMMDGNGWQASCTECHCGTPNGFQREHFAIAAWEKRASTSREAALVEAAVLAERDRCAKIAEFEAAYFDKERIAFNEAGRYKNDADREIGVSIHAKRTASENIGGLIRLEPSVYEAAIARALTAKA